MISGESVNEFEDYRYEVQVLLYLPGSHLNHTEIASES